MTEAKFLMAGLLAALALGVTTGTAVATPCPKGNIVLAADESQAANAKTDETRLCQDGQGRRYPYRSEPGREAGERHR